MNRVLSVLVFLIMLILDSSLSSSEVSNQDECKMYVVSTQVFFVDNKIFIQAEDDFFQVDSLMTDEVGIYYRLPQGYPKNWECGVCGSQNENIKYCQVCGYWPHV